MPELKWCSSLFGPLRLYHPAVSSLENCRHTVLENHQYFRLDLQAEEKGRGLRASEIARLSQDKAAKIAVGDVVEGVVSHCTDFGAFVRIGDGKDLTSVEVGILSSHRIGYA